MTTEDGFSRTIKLFSPKRLADGPLIREVIVRRPSGLDRLAMDAMLATLDPEDHWGAVAVAIASTTGLPAAIISSLELEDLRQLAEAVDDILETEGANTNREEGKSTAKGGKKRKRSWRP